MRHALAALAVVAALALVPAPASAGFGVEVSAGSGVQLSPSVERTPVNVMVAPGYGLAGLLRLELGLVGNLGDVQNSKFDLELRPMVVISPPLFPLYLRAIFAVQNLVDGPTTLAYGGALGLSFGLAGVGLFVEAGVLPRNAKVAVATGLPVFGATGVATRDEFRWFLEGRAGLSFGF